MLVIPAGITPLLLFKRQMDVDEETEVRSLAEEDEVILSQSVVKRIKAEHSNQRPEGLNLFFGGKWGGVWGILSKTGVLDPMWGAGLKEPPYAQSILVAILC